MQQRHMISWRWYFQRPGGHRAKAKEGRSQGSPATKSFPWGCIPYVILHGPSLGFLVSDISFCGCALQSPVMFSFSEACFFCLTF